MTEFPLRVEESEHKVSSRFILTSTQATPTILAAKFYLVATLFKWKHVFSEIPLNKS